MCEAISCAVACCCWLTKVAEEPPVPTPSARLAYAPCSLFWQFCFDWCLHKRGVFEKNHFRFLGKCRERESLLVRNPVAHVGLAFCPLLDASKQLRFVDLAEFLAPRVCVFPGISDHRDVANLVGAGLAQDESFRRPRHRPPHRFTAIVVVMRVRDQDGVGMDVRREIISQPNSASVGINENLLAGRRGYAEAGMGYVLNGYGAILLGGFLSANVAGRQYHGHE